MDSDKIEVSVEDIESNLMELYQAIQNISIGFCFNIDVMGHSEFMMQSQKLFLYQLMHDEAQILVDRSGKHASCIAFLPKDFSVHTQYAIQRKTIDNNLHNYVSEDSL